MTQPLIELKNVTRRYQAGDEEIAVLKSVNLSIQAGEMVAIVGASGSGKSTLMNIIGCLDQATEGEYRINGRDTREMQPDDLAALRREHFGFIFQRYHLLGDLDAVGNVEIPAIYAGIAKGDRATRAKALLERLGLGNRQGNRPGQLSGGQQQRVSIARALMNGGDVILADEPTGALDSQSGKEVMEILKTLHQQGHTIILVTHDMSVASHADRRIEIQDGCIINDTQATNTIAAKSDKQESIKAAKWSAWLDRFREAMHMSVKAMLAHRLRTFLTMLGIIIGIASVVSVVALGEGSRQRILKQISSMGTNTIDVFPGSDFGDERSGKVQTLVPADAEALAEQPFVDSVTPSVSTSASTRYRDISVSTTINGVGNGYFRVRGLNFAQGNSFDKTDEADLAQSAVIDDNTYKKLFGGQGNVIGQTILVGSVPARIIGVTEKKDSGFGNNSSLNIWLPYTTVMGRMTGGNYLKSLTVRVKDSVSTSAAEDGIVKLMTLRHGRKDFFIFNTDTIRQTIEQTTQTMTLLVSMIAVISLVVGGIGVMNIMLVSVTERTKEIGVRMAIGARQSDIMQQFLIEAVLVCLIGGCLGVGAALGIGFIFDQFSSSFTMVYSTTSMVSAFACSTLIGVVFGYLPAKNAAKLNPVDALSRD
ncbi:MacB family efflux pump subunit [Leeia sp. TBRC 13508]|uniref:Pyoverdine export ATP-binding/permease protein PvdT n=1 Tax=Leeia speluncae TaxID=2884804 RepID=A0ABS8D8R6_9NEIS|nr:MacB family efflux pump subunit [Leeia speluncae]MCB6184619.1 MacB family efflux pump subunit [Leeia speluncae]